jgi:hypothetical protein
MENPRENLASGGHVSQLSSRYFILFYDSLKRLAAQACIILQQEWYGEAGTPGAQLCMFIGIDRAM